MTDPKIAVEMGVMAVVVAVGWALRLEGFTIDGILLGVVGALYVNVLQIRCAIDG